MLGRGEFPHSPRNHAVGRRTCRSGSAYGGASNWLTLDRSLVLRNSFRRAGRATSLTEGGGGSAPSPRGLP
ncbi:MAG: hypothetical protein ACQGTM_13510 [bacterium]